MKLKKVMALTMAVVMGVSMAGCGGSGKGSQPAAGSEAKTAESSQTETTSAPATIDAKSAAGDEDALAQEMVMPASSTRDTVNIQVSSDPGSLCPFNTGGGQSANIIYKQICEPLFDYGFNYEVVPILAESWEQTDDTHYTFHLREGVKYTDGNDFTAKDVIFSIKMYAADPAKKQYVKTIDIENTKIIDDHTIEIALTKPDAYFMSCFKSCVIMNEDSYNNSPDKFAEKPIGTGPYKLESYIGGNSAKLVANEDYWEGTPAIKNVNIKVINDVSQRCIELETGGVDLVVELGQTDYGRIESDDRFNAIIKPGYKSNSFYFNCSEHSIFNDVRVRQAVAYAIDNAAIFAAIYQNKFGSVSTAFPSNGMIDYDTKWEEGGYYSLDVEKAKSLLQEAGIAEGTKITIITNEDKTLLSNCEIVQAMLSQIGLTAEISSYEKAVYNSAIDDEAGGWDMATNAFTAPSGYVADMGYAYFAKDGINRSCYFNQELEDAVVASTQITDDAKRKELTDKIVQILQDEVPAYAYTRLAVNWAWVKELKGFNVWGQNDLFVKYLYFE
ncbi:ABC transporter substrate-binding protein [Clostridium sp. MCC353]|uniref:ABC transporter substrate-binding protein n=1 Tax=Clostridium sp. MCC353 TaxID=2592646 RepID=UPI001C00FD04|nr:ABC transporter substrate-binding protein [Clostridium sp. MCC353]